MVYPLVADFPLYPSNPSRNPPTPANSSNTFNFLFKFFTKITNQAFNKGFAGGANLSRGQEHEKEGEAQVNKAVKRVIGVNKAVNKLTKEEQDFIDALNTDTLDEARGRPKKAGGKDFTINPRTKEKLMHDPNALRRTG